VNCQTKFAKEKWFEKSKCVWEKLDDWVNNPKHIVMEDCRTAWPDEFQEHRKAQDFQRWSGHKATEVSSKPGCGSHTVEMFCAKILGQMDTKTFRKDEDIHARGRRKEMVKQASEGHYGDEVWTTMNLDGQECVSSGVHVIGFFVGYTGYNGNKASMCPSRIHSAYESFDIKMLPSSLRARNT